MIVTRIGRLLLIGLFVILCSQFTLSGWAGNGPAGAPSDPFQSQDQRPLDPVKTEEPAEDDDDRSGEHMEWLIAGYQLPTELPVRFLSWRASNDRDQTQRALLFRPPSLL